MSDPPAATAVEVGGLRTNVLAAGAGEPPVLLVHGWGGDATTWQATLAALAGERRALAVDMPGFGRSQPPPADWSVGDFAEFTVQLLDVLGIEQADVVGRSFGGRVAIKLAAQHPSRVRTLLLLNAAGLPEPRTLSYRARVAAAKAAKALLSTPLTRGLRERARQRAYRGRVRESDSSQASIGTFKLVVAEDLSADLARVGVPTLVVAGAEDTVVPLRQAERMAALVPGARLEVIAGAGHQTHRDAPDRFHELLRAHLGLPPAG